MEYEECRTPHSSPLLLLLQMTSTTHVKNGLRKLLVIGKTGTGKSTLCNVIAGKPPESELFPVSASSLSCTQQVKFANINFNKDSEKLLSLIDTIGFDDPKNDTDAIIIAELMDKLMNYCDKVDVCAIVVNGQNPRLEGSLVAVLEILQVN